MTRVAVKRRVMPVRPLTKRQPTAMTTATFLQTSPAPWPSAVSVRPEPPLRPSLELHDLCIRSLCMAGTGIVQAVCCGPVGAGPAVLWPCVRLFIRQSFVCRVWAYSRSLFSNTLLERGFQVTLSVRGAWAPPRHAGTVCCPTLLLRTKFALVMQNQWITGQEAPLAQAMRFASTTSWAWRRRPVHWGRRLYTPKRSCTRFVRARLMPCMLVCVVE